MSHPKLVLLFVVVGACANDPEYLVSPTSLEAGVDNGMGTLSVAKSSLTLPIMPESTKDAAARMALAAQIGNGVMVPYVRVGDLDVEVDYTIKNLDTMPGQAKIELNGANEFFTYDPSMIPVGPEQPPMPGLQGDRPIDIPASSEIQGVFREDQLLEASIDLDQITRANINPFAATLVVNKNDQKIELYNAAMLLPTNPTCVGDPTNAACLPTDTGRSIPRAAFAQMIRVDLVFTPDRHMTMDYSVRVRDHRGIVELKGLAAPTCPAANNDCQITFMPTMYK